MNIEAAAKANMEALRANVYPGRGIVIGQTPDAKRLVQVYWIMGRSE
ncbi:MAG: IMP cyclohydrolase, partial [Planctomycetota bacterium]